MADPEMSTTKVPPPGYLTPTSAGFALPDMNDQANPTGSSSFNSSSFNSSPFNLSSLNAALHTRPLPSTPPQPFVFSPAGQPVRFQAQQPGLMPFNTANSNNSNPSQLMRPSPFMQPCMSPPPFTGPPSFVTPPSSSMSWAPDTLAPFVFQSDNRLTSYMDYHGELYMSPIGSRFPSLDPATKTQIEDRFKQIRAENAVRIKKEPVEDDVDMSSVPKGLRRSKRLRDRQVSANVPVKKGFGMDDVDMDGSGTQQDSGVLIKIKKEHADDIDMEIPKGSRNGRAKRNIRVKNIFGMDDVNMEGSSAQQDVKPVLNRSRFNHERRMESMNKDIKIKKRIKELKAECMNLDINEAKKLQLSVSRERKMRKKARRDMALGIARTHLDDGNIDEALKGLTKRLRRSVYNIQEQLDVGALENLKFAASFYTMSQAEKDEFLLDKLCKRCGAYHSTKCTAFDREEIANGFKAKASLIRKRKSALEELDQMNARNSDDGMTSLNEGLSGMKLKEQLPLPDFDVPTLDLDAVW